ncbi:MAG: hypothetical protein AAGL89_13940 [Pseudomonadota bacterium]
MTILVQHAPTLGTLSKALQSLHYSLLEYQAYRSGFTGSPLDLFDRATKGGDFAWLRPLREAIVTLDERRADNAPLDAAEVAAISDWIGDMLDADDSPLRVGMNAAYQHDATAIVACRSARRALSNLAA